MKCGYVRERIHDYLDFRLAGKELTAVEAHLAECRTCFEIYEEFVTIRKALSTRISPPDWSSSHLLERLQKRTQRNPRELLTALWSRSLSSWQDLDRRAVWSKIIAVPLTLCCFVLLIQEFSALQLEGIRLPVMSLQGWTASSDFRPPIVRTFETRKNQVKFKNLMEAAWRLPYEDSLSLVAEITPDGHAEIDNVLEYPKSGALLDAVDLALRESEFETAEERARPFVIFSFQKIDVWAGRKGL